MDNIIVIGQINNDIQTNNASGVLLANIPLLVQREWTNPDGGKGTYEQQFYVRVRDKVAEACVNNLKKDDSLMLDGRLSKVEYTTRTGDFRAILQIQGYRTIFLGDRPVDHYIKITGIGNLGRDPEMRYMDDGTPVTNFSVAFNHYRRVEGADPIQETEWADIDTWRQIAERCNDYLRQGSKVYIESDRVSLNLYTSSNGENRASTRIRGQRVRFLTPVSGGQPGEGNGGEAGGYSGSSEGDGVPW